MSCFTLYRDGDARTATERMCAVARYYDISSKADRGDIFIIHDQKSSYRTPLHGGGSIMVLGCMTTAGTGELWFIEGNMHSNMYCDILKQKMIPSFQKLFSNITTTPNTPPRWQLPCCWRWRWWSGQVCLQTWTLLSTCGASSSGRWRSTMCLTSSSSMIRDAAINRFYY